MLAEAVLEMFPEAKLGTGPVTDNGFYYDFDLPRTLIPEDLKLIEKKMRKFVQQNQSFVRRDEPLEPAKEFLKKIGQPYKIELVEKFAEQKGVDTVSFYENVREADGKAVFVDLCEGGHVENTREIDPKSFKLSAISSAYWQADENNAQMQRIYGLAFESAEELKKFEMQLEEARKRDHRKIGKELGLFTFSELVGAGLPLFTQRGTLLRDTIIKTIQGIQSRYGYQNVWIPHIAKRDLYETSGHWDKFKDDLFHVKGKHDTEFVMKPMNCPHHTQIYKSQRRSYRDLPMPMAEVTTNYRDEQPGELLGLSRVRSLTQDDGHVFCTVDQIKEVSGDIVKIIKEFYTLLGMWGTDTYWVSLSVRDPEKPEKYLGESKNWDKAEKFLEEIAQEQELNFKRVEGEAAFYGPKLDFMFLDALGREWQLATIQIDFVMPQRFELEYDAEDNKPHRPVMVHRAIAGSIERFLSVIIEHFAGAFPYWLAPVQTKILPVSDPFLPYAQKIADELRAAGVRVEVDASSETLGKKIRKAELEKIPYMMVVGEKEQNESTVNVRDYATKEQKTVKVGEFLKQVESA